MSGNLARPVHEKRLKPDKRTTAEAEDVNDAVEQNAVINQPDTGRLLADG